MPIKHRLVSPSFGRLEIIKDPRKRAYLLLHEEPTGTETSRYFKTQGATQDFCDAFIAGADCARKILDDEFEGTNANWVVVEYEEEKPSYYVNFDLAGDV